MTDLQKIYSFIHHWFSFGEVTNSLIPVRVNGKSIYFVSQVTSYGILCNLREQFATDFGWEMLRVPIDFDCPPPLCWLYRNPREFLTNHIWFPLFIGIHRGKLFGNYKDHPSRRIKEHDWWLFLRCYERACVSVCRRDAAEKNLINDAHLSLPWLSKCKQRTQLFACGVISQRWQVFSPSLSPFARLVNRTDTHRAVNKPDSRHWRKG